MIFELARIVLIIVAVSTLIDNDNHPILGAGLYGQCAHNLRLYACSGIGYHINRRVEKMSEYRYEIRTQSGLVLSHHRTREAAEARHQRDLAWRCGICGSAKGGWAKCAHGNYNRVCTADHYNDRIVQIG